MSEPIFSAAKNKLDLPPKLAGKLSKLAGWLFDMEQYCDVVGIVKSIYRFKLAVSRLKHNAFTCWQQLTNGSDKYKLGKLGWSKCEVQLVIVFSDVDHELRLHHQLGALR